MRTWLNLALRELLGNRRFSLLFIINLAIGLAGFVAIGSFSNSLGLYFSNNLRSILTADLMLYANRPFTQAEIAMVQGEIPEIQAESEQVAFFSMVRGKDISRLVQIIAIDDHYPLYGSFTYEGTTNHGEVLQQLQEGRVLLMSQDTAGSLNIGPGEMVRVGDQEYSARFFYSKDPDKEVTSIELAPRVYMGIGQLQNSGLTGFGSRVSYMHYFRLPEAQDSRPLSLAVREQLNKAAGGDSDIVLYNIHDVNRRLGRLSRYFTGYMGLVGVVALFLAGIAASYLFREYLQARVQQTAVLRSLGATRLECGLVSFLQLTILGLGAALLSLVISYLLLPQFPRLFEGLIPGGLEVEMHLESALTALFLGVSGSLVFCLPVFLRIFSIKPLLLLQGSFWEAGGTVREKVLLVMSLIPALLIFYYLAVHLTGSHKQGAAFTLGVFLVVVLFSIIGWLFFTACKSLSGTTNVVAKIAFRNLYRNRLPSISIFVTIATGVFLVNLIPQIQTGILAEIRQPQGLEIPTFFLVDIQEEQKQNLEDYFRQSRHTLINISPMVRGKISAVNDVPFHQRSNRQQRVERGGFRRTEFNFSSRTHLDLSETIIQGKPLTTEKWSPAAGLPFEISLSQHFGERHDLHLGDRISFDIQGIQLTGMVVNIRKVRWNSFQPNFFLLFQQGVLEDAPKTYLASVAGVDQKEKSEVRNQLVDSFPNLSVIDVSRTVTRIAEIAERLTFAIRFMAYLAILTGMVALYSIARNEAQRHRKETNLLKVLGAGLGEIRRITMLEFGVVGLSASCVAILLSYGLSYVLSWWLFERVWAFAWRPGIILLISTTCTCILTALLATNAVVKRKPVELLH